MKYISTKEFLASKMDRVMDHEVRPGLLLGLRSLNRRLTPFELPMFVLDTESKDGFSTSVLGRLVQSDLTPVRIQLRFTDGFFTNSELARSVGNLDPESEGYALPILAHETGLTPEALGVLAFSDIVTSVEMP
jgi:hypothetical protein